MCACIPFVGCLRRSSARKKPSLMGTSSGHSRYPEVINCNCSARDKISSALTVGIFIHLPIAGRFRTCQVTRRAQNSTQISAQRVTHHCSQLQCLRERFWSGFELLCWLPRGCSHIKLTHDCDPPDVRSVFPHAALHPHPYSTDVSLPLYEYDVKHTCQPGRTFA